MMDKLKKIGVKYNLTSIQLAHFAGQLSHESLDFKIVSENLNYSAERLLQVFPKYFTKELAQRYARKPILIANRVYANRMGNSDEKSGDGWKYRGRGFIQLTGKKNYEAFSKFIGEDCVYNPDLVSLKYALESALWFFFENKIFTICKDLSDDCIKKVTKKINGGLTGINDRKTQVIKFKKIFSC